MKASDVIMTPINREGHAFVAGFLVVSLILFWFWEPLGWAGLVLTLWCLYFFRDPERVVPDDKGVMVSPADGVVSAISRVKPPKEVAADAPEMTRISIFLSVFNVHVNRTPIEGTVKELAYVPGQFLNAADDDASEKNERQVISVESEDGDRVIFAQVAGLVARRIICQVEEGQKLARGERIGLIRFGSRLDIYLPDSFEESVKVGQIMIAGESLIARKDVTADAKG